MRPAPPTSRSVSAQLVCLTSFAAGASVQPVQRELTERCRVASAQSGSRQRLRRQPTRKQPENRKCNAALTHSGAHALIRSLASIRVAEPRKRKRCQSRRPLHLATTVPSFFSFNHSTSLHTCTLHPHLHSTLARLLPLRTTPLHSVRQPPVPSVHPARRPSLSIVRPPAHSHGSLPLRRLPSLLSLSSAHHVLLAQ